MPVVPANHHRLTHHPPLPHPTQGGQAAGPDDCTQRHAALPSNPPREHHHLAHRHLAQPPHPLPPLARPRHVHRHLGALAALLRLLDRHRQAGAPRRAVAAGHCACLASRPHLDHPCAARCAPAASGPTLPPGAPPRAPPSTTWPAAAPSLRSCCCGAPRCRLCAATCTSCSSGFTSPASSPSSCSPAHTTRRAGGSSSRVRRAPGPCSIPHSSAAAVVPPPHHHHHTHTHTTTTTTHPATTHTHTHKPAHAGLLLYAADLALRAGQMSNLTTTAAATLDEASGVATLVLRADAAVQHRPLSEVWLLAPSISRWQW